VAQLLALITAMRWGAVTVERNSETGPPCRARWPMTELTGAMRRRGGGEGASARWCLSATSGARQWLSGLLKHREQDADMRRGSS
jgi:hypothetical protein